MHDIDRTQAEYWGEVDGYELGEFGFEGEMGDQGEFEFQEEADTQSEDTGPFSEVEEMELAAALLEISDEAELDQFLGNLFRRIGRGVGKVIRSPVFRTLGRTLKGIARRALPIVGGALGNIVAPGIGGVVGSRLASTAGSMFGLELEGMSAEDQEFEVARRFVRLSGEAARQAAMMPVNQPPDQVARIALMRAAQQHAPGLISVPPGAAPVARRQRGIWRRRGNVIVLYGV
ncbi:MAG: hypothetical protein SNJ69_02680 [Chloroflexaceae bacterium]